MARSWAGSGGWPRDKVIIPDQGVKVDRHFVLYRCSYNAIDCKTHNHICVGVKDHLSYYHLVCLCITETIICVLDLFLVFP